MALPRRAVIDIGTNSVKLLVGEVEPTGVKPLWEESEQTRLGQGFYESHRLQAGAISRTAAAVARFAQVAHSLQARPVRVIATSAAREAVNREELLKAVTALSQLPVEVLSGEQEADWAYAGVRSESSFRQGALLILDVGGGSTEFIFGHGSKPVLRQSYAMGTVRLMERFQLSDPPTIAEWEDCWAYLQSFLSTKVRPVFGPILNRQEKDGLARLVGTGGTTSILAAMELGLAVFDREKIDLVTLTRERLRAEQQRLWKLPLEDRRHIAGLPPNRADVILFGVAVFLAVTEIFNFEAVRVSTRGLRFAALLEGFEDAV